MQSTQNITIVLLLVTAAILSGMLVSGFVATQQDAQALTSVKDGDYIMCTGWYDEFSDFVYVLDIAAEKVNIYFLNQTTGSIALGDSVPLDKLFTGGP